MNIKIGRRLIMYMSGYTSSGKSGQVCIGVITEINDGRVSIAQYGYDISEDNYAINAYTYGSYSISEVRIIISAQRFLKSQFKDVDIRKEPSDFYQSEKMIQLLK